MCVRCAMGISTTGTTGIIGNGLSGSGGRWTMTANEVSALMFFCWLFGAMSGAVIGRACLLRRWLKRAKEGGR